ncbi:EAL domain-containing protein [Shewanella eurypsychrophilus]|uniref:EAL domain-containing protein n=1 Tax=Shewanella eurypsychrophilus TaxID=2593656 RepID=A0ABX8S5C4_9GAMM|nr:MULTISPECIES: EAL domain-containing protein [Shewanella]QXP44898.1 EAL domain-containing protein [Shewanella eurypsychrophilus]
MFLYLCFITLVIIASHNHQVYAAESIIRVGLIGHGEHGQKGTSLERFILTHLEESLPYKIEVELFISKLDATQALARGDIDLVPDLIPNGEDNIHFSIPYYEKSAYVYSHEAIREPTKLTDKTLFVERGNPTKEFLEHFLSSYKIAAKVEETDSLGDLFMSGTSEPDCLIVASSSKLFQFAEKYYALELGFLGEVVFGISLQRPDLEVQLNRLIKTGKLRDELFKFSSESLADLKRVRVLSQLSKASRQVIQDKFYILVDSDYAPYSFWSDTNQHHSGLLVQTVHQLGSYFTGGLNVIERKASEQNWNLIIDDFESNPADLVLVSGAKVRASNLHISRPLAPLDIALFKHESTSYEDALRIGVIESDAGHDIGLEFVDNYQDFGYSLKLYTSVRALKSAYDNGEIDALIHNSKFNELYYGSSNRILARDYIYFASSNHKLINAIDELLLYRNNSSQFSEEFIQEAAINSSRLDRHLIEENNRLKLQGYLYLLIISLLFSLSYVLYRFHSKSKLHAIYDPLTNVRNRRSFYQRQKLISQMSGTCIIIDIDDFKSLNDNHGHKVGDEVLIYFAQELCNSFTQGCTYRLSGDEFFVYIEKETLCVKGQLERLLGHCELGARGHSRLPKFSFSAGVYCKPAIESDWYDKTDMAMYASKSLGKGKISYFDSKVAASYMRNQFIESNLEQAINNDHLSIVLQPKVDNGSGRIVGVEALARWQTDKYGLIGPVEFISVAETLGLIEKLDLHIAKLTIAAVSVLEGTTSLPLNFQASFNFSLDTIADPATINILLDIINRYDVCPSSLQIEVTETQLLQDKFDIAANLNFLKMLGFTIALDDFSTGNSSIKHLALLPFDCVKLDKELLSLNKEYCGDCSSYFSSVVEMLKQFKLQIVAEGVETKVELEYMKQNGIDLIQGYYFFKPMPLDELVQLFKRENDSTEHIS